MAQSEKREQGKMDAGADTVISAESKKKYISLYESIEGGNKVRCRLCGKEIYDTAEGYGVKSHARAHVRRGEAKEIHHQSTRCYAGYDIEFVIEVKA